MDFHAVLLAQYRTNEQMVYKAFDELTKHRFIDFSKLLFKDYEDIRTFDEFAKSDYDWYELDVSILEYRNSFTGNVMDCIPQKIEGGGLHVFVIDGTQNPLNIRLSDLNGLDYQITLIQMIEEYLKLK